ncbi:Ca(2+)-dependent cysteine protease [Orbilia oligospora]|uniref:Ca(2+)-dependent cysteine protease n=1 Tax=Orbilia oligospora TaxID=2813651 RepID=A0A7C8PC88_ORBOL|nr:Ca(2+)-dependent cysteine protease [Orbilia oligospora]KAF3101563.1 Ca(2+)-dependent cysteine protease [Orbilia oligospora]KAF3105564.1 Ca(2+)-dependent cysteine protease [Orbilia oligospora]KAF3127647.1 Ca(2+)-dependent cysteine protease [Orbilia oligospora]KAF3134802.1 Ca(2+)-dependent cysteine protease [Orbilia oligospora]
MSYGYQPNGPSDSYATSQFYGGGGGPPLPPRPNSGYMNSQQPPYPYQQGSSPYPQYQQPQNYGPPGGYPSPQPPFGGLQHQGTFYGNPQQYPPSHSPQPPTGYGMPSHQPTYSSADQWGAPPPGRYPTPGQLPTYSTNQWTRSQQGPRPPPTSMQTYNHGGGTGLSYQHSTCQGKRKALLIGINYFNTKRQLNGCINDVMNVRNFLIQSYKYKPEDMVILTDDQSNPLSVPKRDNILRAMKWLVTDAQPNDSLFFHFSGHGGQVRDLDGDEADGYDETIYPVDYATKGHIVDDLMHDIMVKPLKPGVRLTAIFDSCHSGTALDLPFVYSTAGTLKEQNLFKEAGMGILGAVVQPQTLTLGGVMQGTFEFLNKATVGRGAEERAKKTKFSPADVIQWSGSKDSQTSADDKGGGVMSRAFIKCLSRNPNQSYKQMLNSLREELDGKYSQKPQLSCSHPLDTDLLFIM